MAAIRDPMQSAKPKAFRTCFGRWAVSLGLMVALVVSLFHDLPAMAATAVPDPIPVAAVFSANTPAQQSDRHGPAVSCHCLCHVTSQAFASPVVTPIIFSDALRPPSNSTTVRSCAGLPPFRPPRA